MTDKLLKVHATFVFDAEARSRVRAVYKRGGQATRRELRVWLQHILDNALDVLPPPKQRARKAQPVAVVATQDPRVVCTRCGHTFDEHVGRTQNCPLSKSTKPGARFTTIQQEAR